jgi:hypothetical protein
VAILAAEIRKLHDCANENFAAKSLTGGRRCALVQNSLFTVAPQQIDQAQSI